MDRRKVMAVLITALLTAGICTALMKAMPDDP